MHLPFLGRRGAKKLAAQDLSIAVGQTSSALMYAGLWLRRAHGVLGVVVGQGGEGDEHGREIGVRRLRVHDVDDRVGEIRGFAALLRRVGAPEPYLLERLSSVVITSATSSRASAPCRRPRTCATCSPVWPAPWLPR